jgi:hypothetical protein
MILNIANKIFPCIFTKHTIHCQLMLTTIPAILCLLNLLGCSGSYVENIHRTIDRNSFLTPEERDYAKRYFDLCVIESGYLDQLSIKMTRMGSPGPYAIEIPAHKAILYQKWGLGNGPFNLHEKAYLDYLEVMATIWDRYQLYLLNIDIDHLREIEKSILNDIHRECGTGPINLRKCWTNSSNPLSPRQIYITKLIYALMGRDEVSDKEYLAITEILHN